MLQALTLLALLSLNTREETITPYNCPKTGIRNYEDNGHFYVIEAIYDECGVATIPSTMPPGAAHYEAIITVYQVIGGSRQRITQFNGVWTESGCFEDDPKTIIEKVLEK